MSSQSVVGSLAVELGLSDEQFKQALAHAQVQAEQAARQMQQKVNTATQQTAAKAGTGVNPQGLLAVSRAIDDVQYGFRGVINNIESIVTGLGGSAGVAGAATIAAVAIASIGPKIADIVSSVTPMEELADTLKSIQNSGINNTFIGIAAEAKATQAAFEASSKELEKLRITKTVSVGFAFEGAMANPNSGIEIQADPREVFRRRVEVNQLAQDAARTAFEANRGRGRVAAAGLARFDQTEAQKGQVKLNQELFQAAVDKFGGGQNLADALKIKNLGDPQLFGAFKEGDIKATEEVTRLLGLQAEAAKIRADEFERATGAAKELARIEEQQLRQQSRIDERQFTEYQRAVTDQDRLFSRRDAIMSNLNRSEIVGSADVFAKNLNAGQKSPELAELEKINESIKELGTLTGILN